MKAVARTKAPRDRPEVKWNRKPSVPASPPTTVELRGVSIHFPFQPYKCQEDYMTKVLDALHHSENALLESPTGTGKTLCLLCAALAWQREQARSLQKNPQHQLTQEFVSSTEAPNIPSRIPTIIYASRTHSQLSQVVRELRSTRYRPKHALLGSREQMCINPKVKTARSTVADINHECGRLSKDRKCGFRNNLEGFHPDSNEPGANGTQPVMDMEDLIAMGNSRKVCPFYYTRSLVQDAELILVPYNYLFDKDARETTLQDVPWKNAVVIFDEAHNLETFASDSASFDLSSTDISGCIAEVQKVIGYQQAMSELVDRISADNLVRLKSIFLSLEEHILTQIPNDRQVFSGEYMMKIFSEGARITHENHAMFVNEAKKVSEIIMDLRSGTSKGQTKIDFFIGCVKRVFGETTEGRCFAKARAYRVHVSAKAPGSNTKGRTVSYWCFAPSLAMEELSNLSIRSIIVTSGTLSPLPSYSLELGIPLPHTLENPHIIADDQIHVRVVGTGVSGKQLSSSYNRRDDIDYVNELGSTIVNFARVVPDGMLIFFPSYSVMANCIEKWGGPSSTQREGNYINPNGKNSFFAKRGKQKPSAGQYSFPHAPNFYASSAAQNMWKRLLCQKAIIIEPKSTSELPDAIADFHKYLNLEKSSGCILMGVCRGKISEGIDFSHHMCRAVLITGLPFAPYLDPKIKLKREYLDGVKAGLQVKPTGEGGFGGAAPVDQSHLLCLSGTEWYTQQAHRAVNQAVGRVIRNKYDYGAVILLDSRFGDPRNRDGLSKWVRTRVLPDESFGIALSALVKFYKEAKAKALELEAARAATQRVDPRPGILLEYEGESSESTSNMLSTKIAIVRTTFDRSEIQEGGQNLTEQSNAGYVPPDQVLATMDFNSLKSDLEPKITPCGGHSEAVEIRDSGLADLYKSKLAAKSSSIGGASDSAWSTLPKRQSVDAKTMPVMGQNTNGSNSTKPLDPKLSAQIFFSSAKRRLEEVDFSLLRKLLVEMKKHGDNNDNKSYMKAAGSLMIILAQYDNLEDSNFEWEHSLLYLFIPVLPLSRQVDVQKLALRVQLGRSNFIKHCRRYLPHDEHRAFYASVFTALKLTYCIPLKQSFSKSQFVKACLPVVEYLFRNGFHKRNLDSEIGSLSILDMFCSLLPLKLRHTAKALFDDIQAADSTIRTKEREKSKDGETGLDASRFFVSQRMMPSLSQPNSVQNAGNVEEERSMQIALMMAEDVNAAKRARVSAELGQESKSKSLPANSCLHSNSASQQPALGRPLNKPFSPGLAVSDQSATESAVFQTSCRVDSSSNESESTLTDRDRVVRLLRQAEASPFKKAKRQPKIRANLIGSPCRICEEICNEPFMPPCGHLVCSRCWMTWLEKSESCPVCRKPANKDNLVRVVYEEKPGSGVPSLSQLCSRSVDSDSDDELVIV